jgi:hypothetical protein
MKLQRYDIYHEVDGDAFIVKECRDDGAHMDAGEALDVIEALEKCWRAVAEENKRLRETLNDIEKKRCKLCGSSELALDALEAKDET